MQIKTQKGHRVCWLVRQLWNRIFDDELPGTAAQLSYYLLFSMFPLLVFLVALVPVLADHIPIKESIEGVLDYLGRMMPAEAMQPIREQFSNLVEKRHPQLLSVGLLVAIWSASRSMDAFRIFFNRAKRVKETRSYVGLQLLAIVFTLILAVSVVIGFSAIILGGKLGIFLSMWLQISNDYFVWLRWPVSMLMMMLAIAAMYALLPIKKTKFRFVILGATVGTALWGVSSFLFAKYVENFGDYNATYGSIGGVIILMTWLYLSSLIFLFGAEISIVLDQDAPLATNDHDEKLGRHEQIGLDIEAAT